MSQNTNYVHWAFWASVADATGDLPPETLSQMSEELEALAESIARCWLEVGIVPTLKEAS